MPRLGADIVADLEQIIADWKKPESSAYFRDLVLQVGTWYTEAGLTPEYQTSLRCQVADLEEEKRYRFDK